MKIRLLLVDDHAVVRIGLRMLFENESDMEIVGEAETASQAIAMTAELQPDVVLLDIGLPDSSGIEAAAEIQTLSPKSAVVALTIHEDEEYFFQMLNAGASGYVPKRAAPGELLTAIRAAAANEVYLYPSMAKLLVRDYLAEENRAETDETRKILTPREEEVLTHLAEGNTNQEIAEKLVISPKTVSRHRENIMRKLNLHSRVELVKYAIRKGIIQA